MALKITQVKGTVGAQALAEGSRYARLGLRRIRQSRSSAPTTLRCRGWINVVRHLVDGRRSSGGVGNK